MSDSEATGPGHDKPVVQVDSGGHVSDPQADGSEDSKKLLAPLQESIILRLPFLGGSLQLPPSQFYLFYKNPEGDHVTRHVNLANATPEELEQLTQICEPASSDHSKEEVTDDIRRKRRKIEGNSFTLMLVPQHTDLIKIVHDYLLEGTDSTRQIKIELSELSVYSKGSLFKSHLDIPRENKFGSLVIAFPTSHEGGALVFRHDSQEWTFDLSTALSAAPSASIAYAAFFGNVEHEVLPVTSGHRVMLTYNLYFDENKDASTKDVVSDPPSFPREADVGTFDSRFADLLKNPKFLPDGGMLAFGLRNVYQVDDGPYDVYRQLKGSDATIYQNLCGLGLDPTLNLFYESETDCEGFYAFLFEDTPDSGCVHTDENLDTFMSREGGILIPEKEGLAWVTPQTDFNDVETPYTQIYYRKGDMYMMRGSLCLTVRIGEAGKRLVHSTDAQP